VKEFRENQLIFGDVMGKSLVSCFFDSRCGASNYRSTGIFLLHPVEAIFTARRYASAVYAVVLFVCPSQTSIVLKRLDGYWDKAGFWLGSFL